MDIQGYWDALVQVVREPTSNLAAAALLMAAVTLIVLMIVVGLLFFFLPREEPEGESRTEAEAATGARRKARRRHRSAHTDVTIVLLLILASAGIGYATTSTQRFCAGTCHAEDDAVAQHSEGAHSGVDCVRCHEAPGAGGLVAGLIQRTGHVLADVSPIEGSYPPPAPEACLECHSAVLGDVVRVPDSGLIVSHAEPLDAGMGCDDCHLRAGHTSASMRPRVMSVCVRCHDGDSASGECSTCHDGDPALAAADAQDRPFTRVSLGPVEDCEGCHDNTACTECHGLVMPHTTAFKSGAHAAQAGFGLKEVCWRCHVPSDCGPCHLVPFTSGHGPQWEEAHKTLPWDSVCGTCHKGHTGSFCDRCHER
ncbi:MAG: hypothetical protein Kow0056_06610 [Coriobacteriia bacterium]